MLQNIIYTCNFIFFILLFNQSLPYILTTRENYYHQRTHWYTKRQIKKTYVTNSYRNTLRTRKLIFNLSINNKTYKKFTNNLIN